MGLSIVLIAAIAILLPLFESIVSRKEVDLYYQNTSCKPYIVLEFDDGYLETYTKAYPILKKYGFKAIVMLPIGFIGIDEKHRKYFYDLDLRNGTSTSFFPTLSINEVRKLVEEGWDIQCHSYSHSHLPAFNLSNAIEKRNFLHEILTCKVVLKEWFNIEAIAFTPPYLSWTEEQLNILKQHYKFIVAHANFTVNILSSVSFTYTLSAIPLSHDNFNETLEKVIKLLNDASKECLKSVVVLLMHRVDEDPRAWDITPSELETLCKTLVDAGYKENIVTYLQLLEKFEKHS